MFVANIQGVRLFRVPALKDNYVFLLATEGECVAIDPSEASPVERILGELGVTLTQVWNTHHHWDHTGGNEELKQLYSCKIFSPDKEKDKIPGCDVGVSDDSEVKLGTHSFSVMELPGHTSFHVAYYSSRLKLLFCGDVLFAMGCGRLFEGTAQEMFKSLDRLRKLPDDTLVCCGHEYSLGHAAFSLEIDPDNDDLKRRAENIRERRKKGEATVPFLLREEKATYPFLRPESPSIRAKLKLETSGPLKVFTELRRRKDVWRNREASRV